nr:hypothetical protein Iba_chr02fCG10030 [Ipomoea batatas]
MMRSLKSSFIFNVSSLYLIKVLPREAKFRVSNFVVGRGGGRGGDRAAALSSARAGVETGDKMRSLPMDGSFVAGRGGGGNPAAASSSAVALLLELN